MPRNIDRVCSIGKLGVCAIALFVLIVAPFCADVAVFAKTTAWVCHDEDEEDDEIRFQTVSRLTLSFAEDGTPISRFESSLFSSFSDIMTRDEIESLVIEAFQTWARHSAINVGLVDELNEAGNPVGTGEPGLPFGTGGLSQGDLRFGDIRIGAVPMAGDVFGVAVPNVDFISGTWSGDLLFNSEADFVDANHFFAVAIHEAGHVLGLGHTTDKTSVMHPTALNTVPTPSDIAELQMLYGDRITLDEYDEGFDDNNDTLEEAEEIRNNNDINGIIPLMVFGDIENQSDVDFFLLEPTSNYNGSIEFRVISKGVSFLQPRLRVYSCDESTEQMVFLGESQSSDILGSDISVQIDNVDEDLVYVAKIESAGSEHTEFGSYGLVATILDNISQGQELVTSALRRNYGELDQDELQDLFLNGLMSPIVNDNHTNDTITSATPLLPPLNIALHSAYREQASISNSADIDFYSLVAEDTVMSVRVNALDEFGLIPDIEVFDDNLQLVPGLFKVNGNGELLKEFPGVVVGQTYFVRVAADDPEGPFGTGNYDLNVAFAPVERVLRLLGNGYLNQQSRNREHTLYVARTQLFHFLLSGESTKESNGTIWMSIYDEAGDIRYRVATRSDECRSSKSVILTPGSYQILINYTPEPLNPISASIEGIGSPSERRNKINYSIEGVGVSEPTGPEVIDTADDPFAPCDKSSSDFCYPNGNFSPDPFIFVDDDELDIVPTSPPPLWVDANDWYWEIDWLG